jgi:eukaryotic-like serine/threonine-protein kinase
MSSRSKPEIVSPSPIPPPPGDAAPGAPDDKRGDRLVLEPGKVIARKYVLERPAGFGGMAELWVATNNATNAEVCVKVYVREPGRSDDPAQQGHEAEAIERFRREAYAAARLTHRAIVRVFDLLELDAAGEAISDGRPPLAYAMVMELLHGETLGDLLAKRGKLPLEEALDLFIPVVSALAHAHRASVIHRDLKPDNIFLAVDPDGHVSPKVLDFGVSKLSNADAITNDGVIVGTPSFMAPEQAKGARQVDARCDVFSAGILFYMMLTGANPFEEQSFASVIDAIIRREVAPIPELPPAIWAVLHQALEKDPNSRWGDATEMGIALRKAAGRKATTGSSPMLPLPPPSSSARGPRASGVSRDSASVPPAGPDSIPSHLAPTLSQRIRRRRRTMVTAVILTATLVLIAAVVVPWSRGDRSTKTARSPVVRDVPPPATSPLPTASTTDESGMAGQESAGSSAPSPARSAPRRAPASSRRPGEEPNQARDPGF